MRPKPLIFSTLAVFIQGGAALGDTVELASGGKVEGTVMGIRDGKLLVLEPGRGGGSGGAGGKSIGFSEVKSITLVEFPKFQAAEDVRGTDAKTSAALYKQLITAINNPALKLLAEFRAIEPTDADGRWAEAVGLFLDVYQAQPLEAIWKGRPTHLPGAGSALLKESADRIVAALKTVKGDDAQRNLKTFLVEIYTKAGDTQSAARLVKELTTGVGDEGAGGGGGAAAARAAEEAALAAVVGEIDRAISAKQYDSAMQKTDAALVTSTGESAVRLLALKAKICVSQEKLDDAVAVLLRIAVHYSNSGAAPVALFQAAELEKQLQRPESVKRLLKEIIERYPDSPEAVKARG